MIRLLILMLVLIPNVALAHPEPGFNFPEAEDQGKREIERLVIEKELPETWNNAFSDLDKSGMKISYGKKRWVMVYENPEEKKPAQAFIKIVLTPMGKFVGYEFISADK